MLGTHMGRGAAARAEAAVRERGGHEIASLGRWCKSEIRFPPDAQRRVHLNLLNS